MSSQLFRASVAELAVMVERRDVTCQEVLLSAIERIRETEPRIQAFALLDLEGAQVAARAADREIDGGNYRGPLHGIPVGLKDVIRTIGLATRAGSNAMGDGDASLDAVVVSRLREAGAIIVGKTVTHEFAWGQNIPATRSPWDTRCYPGGSSAGSGVAVATGSLPVAVGTDTAGSIRNPASVNGLVGLKPSHGVVSTSGVIPVSTSLDAVGPLARTVADTRIMLVAMADPRRMPARRQSSSIRRRRRLATEGLRVGIDRARLADGGSSADVVDAVEQAVDVLGGLGVAIVDVDTPDPKDAMAVGMTLALAESAAWHRQLLQTRGLDYDAGTRVMLEVGSLIPARDYLAAREARESVRAALRRIFERNDLTALAGPTMPAPTMPVEELALDFTRSGETGDLAGALLLLIGANVAGLPAVSIPCGLSGAGLPIGLQLTGRPFADFSLLDLAEVYERATPWHTLVPIDVDASVAVS